MQAVILAAGQSSRFYPFRSFGHKAMFPLMGQPLLWHTLQSLKKANITHVVIVISEKSTIPQNIEKIPGLTITFVVQQKALGMGHALAQATPHLEEKFFLLNGYHFDFSDFAKDMIEKQKNEEDIVLLAKEDTLLEKYGVLAVEKDRVVGVVEKPENVSTGLRVIGIYLLTKTFLQTLQRLPVEQYHFEKALDAYAKKGHARYVATSLPTLTLKHAWDMLEVKNYMLSKIKRSISPKAIIASSAIVEGDVVVSDNVIIREGACIKGPCFLGENVTVGNNAIVRNGVIAEKDAVIGATMEIKNSLLMTGATTHTGFIGDSIIGPRARLAAGFCSANVRFDRKAVDVLVQGEKVSSNRVHLGVIIGESTDTGVHVVVMPGILIGRNAVIGPSTTVTENVLDDTVIFTTFKTVSKKRK